METGELFFYTLVIIIIFFILAFITRWVYKINEMIKYQKMLTTILLMIAKKDMNEKEVKVMNSLLKGEIKIKDVKFDIKK